VKIKKKKRLFRKDLDNDQIAFWDFRKEKPSFYVTQIGGDFVPNKDAYQLQEYIIIKKQFKTSDKTEIKNKSVATAVFSGPVKAKPTDIVLRGNEENISNVVMERNLELIVKASKDQNKPGEGILYYDIPKIGFEPSVELIDMITAQMGNVQVEIIDSGTRFHKDVESGDEYQTYYAVVKAIDKITGAEGLGTAEEIIDFREMKQQHRTFALTKAIRKAERNAKERLIPVPRSAMVQLVKEIMANQVKELKKK